MIRHLATDCRGYGIGPVELIDFRPNEVYRALRGLRTLSLLLLNKPALKAGGLCLY